MCMFKCVLNICIWGQRTQITRRLTCVKMCNNTMQRWMFTITFHHFDCLLKGCYLHCLVHAMRWLCKVVRWHQKYLTPGGAGEHRSQPSCYLLLTSYLLAGVVSAPEEISVAVVFSHEDWYVRELPAWRSYHGQLRAQQSGQCWHLSTVCLTKVKDLAWECVILYCDTISLLQIQKIKLKSHYRCICRQPRCSC